jgi:hypothetical protein
MAGQAGWYRAPGEDGMLRYWDGALWTPHRQPVPAPAPALSLVPAMPIAQAPSEPDPMDEYERQFEPSMQSLSMTGQARFDLDQRNFDFPPVTTPRSFFAPEPAPVPAAQPPQDGALATAPPPALTGPIAVADPAPVSPIHAPHDSRNRKGVVGAFRGMLVGILLVVIGLGVMAFLAFSSTPGSGEAKSTGIVTSLGNTTGNGCTPIARFAVTGQSYTANSAIAISPCPVGLGQTVDIVYTVAHPASDARIELGSTFSQLAWLIPVLGGIVLLASLVTFIVRAGSIASGIALIRNGNKRSKKPVS